LNELRCCAAPHDPAPRHAAGTGGRRCCVVHSDRKWLQGSANLMEINDYAAEDRKVDKSRRVEQQELRNGVDRNVARLSPE
jgi:hypothetical protein